MIPGVKPPQFSTAHLQAVLHLVLYRLRLAVLLFALVMAGGLAFYLHKRPIYNAKALIRYQPLNRPMDRRAELVETNFIPEVQGVQLISELQSSYIIELVARNYGRTSGSDRIQREDLRKLTISFNEENNIVVDVYSFDPTFLTWPEKLVAEYVRYREQRKREARELEFEQLAKEMEEIRARFEQDIRQYREMELTNSLFEASIRLQGLGMLPQELYSIKRRKAVLEQCLRDLEHPGFGVVERLSIISSVNRDLQLGIGQVVASPTFDLPSMPQPESGSAAVDQSTPTVVVPSLLPAVGSPWERLEAEQRRLAKLLAELERTYLPGHPKVAALRQNLEAVNRGLEGELAPALQRLRLELASVQKREAELDARVGEFARSSQELEVAKRRADLHKVSQIPWDRVYAGMAKRIDSLEFGADKEIGRIQFLSYLSRSSEPVAPLFSRVLLACVGIGLLLGIVVPLGLEYLDSRVITLEDVEGDLSLPRLGVIPMYSTATSPDAMEKGDPDEERHIDEMFHAMITNISLLETTQKLKVIVVTSSVAGEGKSTISSRLAQLYARRGEPTVLLDMDLRRGGIHATFKVPRVPGLAEYFEENLELEDICRPTKTERLTVVPRGRLSINPAECLGSERFQQLMKGLRAREGRIIVDTPPLLGLPEPPLIVRQADFVAFVMASGSTQLSVVREACQRLQLHPGCPVGLVLNRFDSRKSGAYGNYYYYSRQYYTQYRAE